MVGWCVRSNGHIGYSWIYIKEAFPSLGCIVKGTCASAFGEMYLSLCVKGQMTFFFICLIIWLIFAGNRIPVSKVIHFTRREVKPHTIEFLLASMYHLGSLKIYTHLTSVTTRNPPNLRTTYSDNLFIYLTFCYKFQVFAICLKAGPKIPLYSTENASLKFICLFAWYKSNPSDWFISVRWLDISQYVNEVKWVTIILLQSPF